jgi:hypothetical protein
MRLIIKSSREHHLQLIYAKFRTDPLQNEIDRQQWPFDQSQRFEVCGFQSIIRANQPRSIYPLPSSLFRITNLIGFNSHLQRLWMEVCEGISQDVSLSDSRRTDYQQKICYGEVLRMRMSSAFQTKTIFV